MIITAANPSLDKVERTFLSQAYNLGVTSIEVKNADELSINDRLLIGEQGLEQSEIITLSNINANNTTLTIGATLYSHPANTPIYRLKYDQVKFYRSTTGKNGSYSLLATVSLDVDGANQETTYDDNTAQSGYYYKVSMYNSLSSVESDKSDAMPAITGWDPMQVGYTIEQFYREVSDPTEQIISRDELFGYFQEVNDDLMVGVSKPYSFLETRQVLDRTANTRTLAYPVDSNGNVSMWAFERLDYRYVDNTVTPTIDQTYTLKELPLDYWRNKHKDNTIDTNTTSDQPKDFALDNVVDAFVFFPPFKTTSTYGCFYLYYWAKLINITSEGQFFQTPTSRIYKLRALAKFYAKRAVTDPSYQNIADRYQSDYTTERARYKSQDRKSRAGGRRFVKDDWVTRSFRR